MHHLPVFSDVWLGFGLDRAIEPARSGLRGGPHRHVNEESMRCGQTLACMSSLLSPGEQPRIFKGLCTDGHFTHEEAGWMQKSTVTQQIMLSLPLVWERRHQGRDRERLRVKRPRPQAPTQQPNTSHRLKQEYVELTRSNHGGTSSTTGNATESVVVKHIPPWYIIQPLWHRPVLWKAPVGWCTVSSVLLSALENTSKQWAASEDDAAGPPSAGDFAAGPSATEDVTAGPSVSEDFAAGPSATDDITAGPSISKDVTAGKAI
ncbi:hypothetical protein AOLI_G00118820 [Acnodon oligacanthus]